MMISLCDTDTQSALASSPVPTAAVAVASDRLKDVNLFDSLASSYTRSIYL